MMNMAEIEAVNAIRHAQGAIDKLSQESDCNENQKIDRHRRAPLTLRALVIHKRWLRWRW